MSGTADCSPSRPGPVRRAPARVAAVAAVAAVASLVVTGLGMPSAPPASAAVAVRSDPPPLISKVTTTTLDASSLSSQVRSTTTGIAATYVNDVLTVTWGPEARLIVDGPLAGGTTANSLTATIGVSAGQQCAGPGGLATAAVDQMVVAPGGVVQTLSLQFECRAAGSGTVVFGTVGIDVPPSTRATGYDLVEAAGLVTGFGVGQFLGALGDLAPIGSGAPAVALATTPLDGGSWTAASDGGVFSHGDAGFYGSAGGLHLNRPIVGMAATPDGLGYWLVASDGGIFSYGDAGFYGSAGGLDLNRPIVGMAATPDGLGYWLVASDGGIFSYGDATFHGSTGALRLHSPIVGLASTADGGGYWMAASDGGVFTFGDAIFNGSLGGSGVDDIVGITR